MIDLGKWFWDYRDRVDKNLDWYFHGKGKDAFTGAKFETLADMSHPNRFEASDVLAVEALSVRVPSASAVRLLLDDADCFNAPLADIPTANIWEVERSILDDRHPADFLHGLLQELGGVGPVVAGKLMAAKRPRLIPILDTFVEEELKPPPGQFWISMHEQLSDRTCRQVIEKVCASAPGYVTLLRKIDVAVWMHVRLRKRLGVV